MAEIKLSGKEIEDLQRKLESDRPSMPAEEVAMVQGILNMAKTSKSAAMSGQPDWVFSVWTYRF